LGFDPLQWFIRRTRWEQLAIFVWAGLLLFVTVRVYFAPTLKTVYPIYSSSCQLWWDGEELYDPYRPADVPDGFRYAPSFAILITPFAFLPDYLGGILWRLAGAAALLASLGWLARSVLPGPLQAKHYAWLFLLAIPVSMQSVNNGQVNTHVAACMLAMMAAVIEKRWTLACIVLAIAFICKAYPLTLGMVLILLYPRQLSWRVPLAIAASLLMPFLFQHPAYVSDQYVKWISNLRAEDRSNIPLEHMYRDLWLLFHLYGIPISRGVYLLIQASVGVGIAVLCWQRQRTGWSERALLTYTLTLVSAWMMLLGPSTESSSFALLAPSLAWSIVEALREQRWTLRSGLLAGACAMFLIAISLSSFRRTVRISEFGVHSWASLLYMLYVLTQSSPSSAITAQQGELLQKAA